MKVESRENKKEIVADGKSQRKTAKKKQLSNALRQNLLRRKQDKSNQNN